MPLILSLFLIFIISLFTFLPAFNLGLFGDDWLAFWRYLHYLGSESSGEWNHLSYFLTSYGPEDTVMGILQKIYGFNSVYYQLTSYLLRLVASFSLFPAAWYLTRNKPAAFFAVTFFSVTAIGLETTVWVFNMPSYIAISFLNLFFYFYLKSHDEQKIIPLVLAGLSFALAFLMQPIRMHGLLPFILSLELFWLFQKLSYAKIRQSLFRTIFFISIFMGIFLIFSKSPVAPSSAVSGEIITNLLKLITQGDLFFLLNPIKTIGSIFIPPISSYNQQFFIGSTVILLWILMIIKSRKNSLAQTALFFSFTWLISSFLFAWLRAPGGDPLNSTHRYLIVSAVGIALFLASILGIAKTKVNKYIAYFIAVSLILINITSTRTYLKQQEQTHNVKISNKIWNSIPKIEAIGKEEKPHIFYFEGDGQNSTIIRDVITFGFPPHMALIYNLFGTELLPVPMSEWRDLLSAVRDGKNMFAYGYPEKPVPLDRIYAFQLQGKDHLINITDLARGQLKTILSNQ